MPARKTGRAKRLNPIMVLGVLIGLTFLTAAVSLTLRQERQKDMAKAATWDLDGAPCPTLDAAAFAAKRFNPRQRHQYADIQFGRESGLVSCTDVAADGGRSMSKRVRICHFPAPGGLVATYGGKTTYYDVGFARQATVSIKDGETTLRCVTPRA
jgi:hypothetical protein